MGTVGVFVAAMSPAFLIFGINFHFYVAIDSLKLYNAQLHVVRNYWMGKAKQVDARIETVKTWAEGKLRLLRVLLSYYISR